jgi:nucleoside-diphosphate-sugar epimerase
MKVFIAGSTGVVGKILVAQLVDSGYEVFALARSDQKSKEVEAVGAKAVVVNVLDKDELTLAIKKTEPQIIIHQLTALAGTQGNFKHFDEERRVW